MISVHNTSQVKLNIYEQVPSKRGLFVRRRFIIKGVSTISHLGPSRKTLTICMYVKTRFGDNTKENMRFPIIEKREREKQAEKEEKMEAVALEIRGSNNPTAMAWYSCNPKRELKSGKSTLCLCMIERRWLVRMIRIRWI